MQSINGNYYKRFYANVAKQEKEKLYQFRETHSYKTLDINGNEWSYLFSGKGDEIILLLTGGSRAGESFSLFPELEKHYRVISPTYPIVDEIETLVIDIEEILKKEKLKTIILFGKSLGGMISQVFVRKYPNRVSKLIIANTMSPNPKYNRRSKITTMFLKVLPRRVVRKLAENHLLQLWNEAQEEERDFWTAYYKELLYTYMPKEWIISQFKLSYDFSNNYQFSPDDLKKWDGKMLIIDSEFDEIFGSSLQRELEMLYPQATKHTIENAGHSPTLSKKKEYLSAVFDFLQKS